MFCENIYHICQSRCNSLNTNSIKTDRCAQKRKYLPVHLPARTDMFVASTSTARLRV